MGLRQLWRDRGGVTALEFAFFLPVITVLVVGTFEFGRLFLVTQKIQNGAFILADLAARDKTLSEGELTNIFLAIDQLIRPFDFAQSGRAYVSAVGLDASGDPEVLWQRSGAGAHATSSALGSEGGAAALPQGLVLAAGDTLVVAEVVFDYAPVFGITALGQEIRRSAYYKPRLGTLETLQP